MKKASWGLVVTAFGWGLALPALAQPVFTGNAPADFLAAGVQTVFAPDPNGDVGLPPACPGVTSSGWDLSGVYWYYDRTTDTLHIGLDSVGILGDVDGNGDPASTDPCILMQGGIDFADFAGTEAVVVVFDLDRDGINDFAAGVDANSTIGQFGVSRMNLGDPIPFAVSFGAPRPGLIVTPASNTSAASPDFEFSIGPVASMYAEMGLPFTPNADPGALIFNYQVFCGGFLDDGIGEDVVTPTQLGFVCVGWDALPDGSALEANTPPGVQVLGQFASIGITVDGISHSGNPGAFAYNTMQDPTTDDQIPQAAPYFSQPNVLFTRRAPGSTDSDDGILRFAIVSPYDGIGWSATFADIQTIDVEDSAPRGNANVTGFFLMSAPVTIPLIDAGNNGFQTTTFVASSCADGVNGIIADLGDSEDSAAVDVICFNLCPRVLPIAVQAGDSSSDVAPGERFEMNAHVENVVGERVTVEYSILFGRPGVPVSEWQVMKGPRQRPISPRLDKDVLVGMRVPADAAPGDAFVSVLIRNVQDGVAGSVISHTIVKTVID